jgi:hypothetical protein
MAFPRKLIAPWYLPGMRIISSPSEALLMVVWRDCRDSIGMVLAHIEGASNRKSTVINTNKDSLGMMAPLVDYSALDVWTEMLDLLLMYPHQGGMSTFFRPLIYKNLI